MNARVFGWLVLVVGGCGGSNVATDLGVDAQPAVVDLAAPDLPPTGCAPRPVPYFSPYWAPPETFVGTCSNAQVDEFVKALLAGDYTTFTLVNGACGTCLVSGWSDATLGPVISFWEFDFFDGNQPGCMALVDGDLSPTGCGAKTQVALRCGLASCGDHCETQTQADFKKLNACISKSWEGVCKAFKAPDACSAPRYDACDPAKHPSVAEFIRHVARQFCGSPADGGA